MKTIISTVIAAVFAFSAPFALAQDKKGAEAPPATTSTKSDTKTEKKTTKRKAAKKTSAKKADKAAAETKTEAKK